VPLDFPDDEDEQARGSRWQEQDDKDRHIDPDSNAMSGIFGKRKKNKKLRPKENAGAGLHKSTLDGTTTSGQESEVTEKILDATKALEEMRRLGLEPARLKEFTISLHKLAVASGVSPDVLTSVIKEVSDLCEGKRISLIQARKHIGELGSHKNALVKEVEDFEKKKQALEVDLRLKELENSVSTETLSEYVRTKKELEQHKLSFTDISKLITLINNATEQLGSDSSIIVDALADLKSRQDKRKEVETEIDSLLDSKRKLQDRLLFLEQEISSRQQTLKSAEELRKQGFNSKELDKLYAAIRIIAQTRNIDITAAKDQLLSDLEGYYANDHELKKRIRMLESLLEEKEEKFNMLEADYQNEKAVLDNAKKLISDGFDKHWLEQLQIIIGAYGIDLELLAEELKKNQSLKASISELQRTKQALEEEERLIRQKVVAVEDERIRTLSLIHDMIIKPTKSTQDLATTSAAQGQERERKITTIDWELSELIRAAQGEENISEDKFRISAQKAIDIIYGRLRKNSPARVVLEHAQLALRYEAERNKHSP
jgi:hypothetical protein